MAWRRPISLPSVLKPVSDLRQRQTSLFRQHTLLLRRRISFDGETLFEGAPWSLFEAVDRLLAVPDAAWQRELASQTVLVDGSQRPLSYLLCLRVMTGIPQLHGQNDKRSWTASSRLMITMYGSRFEKIYECNRKKLKGYFQVTRKLQSYTALNWLNSHDRNVRFWQSVFHGPEVRFTKNFMTKLKKPVVVLALKM